MFDELATMMIMMWPATPMFLIELHFGINFWRRIGLLTYVVIVVEWLPLGLALYTFQSQLLYPQIALGTPFQVLGIALIIAALALHGWTAKLIGLKSTLGYTELKFDESQSTRVLVTYGPFSVVRHPSYWAHTAIMAGIFFITGVISVGIIALIDLAITYFITTSLEDRELIARYGKQYREYQKRVPKFFPKLSKH